MCIRDSTHTHTLLIGTEGRYVSLLLQSVVYTTFIDLLNSNVPEDINNPTRHMISTVTKMVSVPLGAYLQMVCVQIG